MKDSLLVNFGDRVREIRKFRKLSQERLAQRAGLHYTYIGGVERGERNISLKAMNKIAVGLSVGLVDFFNGIKWGEEYGISKD